MTTVRYTHGNNIMKQFNIIVKVSFTTSKAGLDFYYIINFTYELPHELPNNLRLRLSENWERQRDKA